MKIAGSLIAVALLFGPGAFGRVRQQDQGGQRTNAPAHVQSNHERGQEQQTGRSSERRTETSHQAQQPQGRMETRREGPAPSGQPRPTHIQASPQGQQAPSGRTYAAHRGPQYQGQQPSTGQVYTRSEDGNRDRQGQRGETYRTRPQNQDQRQYGDHDRDRGDHEREGERMRDNPHFRIPRDRWRDHFGREHRFRIYQPVIVEGYPRFDYDDYWFRPVNPWPSDWSYDDECYIDEVSNEYYLYDMLHPGVRLMLMMLQPY